jgi:hypothetical protein
VLLGVATDKEGRHVDHLLANTDVSLSDKNTGVVDGLGKTLLEDLGLESALHESLSGKLENIIEGVLLVSQETVSLEAADKRGSLEESLRILQVQSQKGTGRLE